VAEHTYSGTVGTLALDTDTNTFYTISTASLSYLYSVDPLTGMGTRLGRVGGTMIDIAYDPFSKQLYGAAFQSSATRIFYGIRTSGVAPLDDFIGSIPNISDLTNIVFDSVGSLYALTGNTTSKNYLKRIDTSTPTATIVETFPLGNSSEGSISYNNSLDEFIITSSGTHRTMSHLSKVGTSSRLAEYRSKEIAYQSTTDTIFRFPDDNINTSKTDLSTTPIYVTWKNIWQSDSL